MTLTSMITNGGSILLPNSLSFVPNTQYLSGSQESKYFLDWWCNRGSSKTSYQHFDQQVKGQVDSITQYSSPLSLLYKLSTRRGPSRMWNIWRGNGEAYFFFWSSCHWLQLSLNSFIHLLMCVGGSGVHWDNKGGCSVGPGMEEVWQEHLKVGVNMILSALNVSDHTI